MRKLLNKIGNFLLDKEHKHYLKLGKRFCKNLEDINTYKCKSCDHEKHIGRCSEPLEYDILSDKDLCACLEEN